MIDEFGTGVLVGSKQTSILLNNANNFNMYRLMRSTISYLLIFYTVSVLFCACSTRNMAQQYSVVSRYDNDDVPNNLLEAEIFVILKGDTLICQNKIDITTENYGVKNGIAKLASKKINSVNAYNCFLSKKETGIKYDSLKSNIKFVKKDSVLSEILYKVGEAYPLISKTKADKAETTKEFVEKYKLTRNSPFEPDSIYYHFSKKKMGLTFMKNKGDRRFMNRMSIVFYQTNKNGKRRTFDFQISRREEPLETDLNKVLVRFRNDTYLIQ